MTKLKKFGKYFGILLLLLIIVYLFGPGPSSPELTQQLPEVPSDLISLKEMIYQRESGDSVRPGNEGFIAFAQPEAPQKTPYCFLYLHGFSASPEEGAPLHRELAERYGCNLYVPRLAHHGLTDEERLLNYTVENAVGSAKEALAIAEQLGDSVILLTCSTGGTLGIYLATGEHKISAILAYSPNAGMFRADSYLLNKPWGLQISRMVIGSDYYTWEGDAYTQAHWYTKYRLEALTQLQEMIETTMTEETFAAVEVPFFMGYFESETARDSVVSLEAMKEMYDQLGTPVAKKQKMAFPNAGAHVICSKHKSGDYDDVKAASIAFLEETLNLSPID